jgi:uncharacterized repeat protein (TIGR04138 family)
MDSWMIRNAAPKKPSDSGPTNLFDSRRRLLHLALMQAMQFEQSVVSILKRDKRFDPHAYFFLKEALDFTLKRVAEDNGGHARHVTGPELLEGFRDFALEQFGPMASTLMREWGVRKCQDVGDMVFHLIEEQVFGKQDSDSREDFSGIFDLEESLVKPFLPKRATLHAGERVRKAMRTKQGERVSKPQSKG